MNDIHPTAVVDPGARIGTGNTIGPFCYIGPNVEIGDNNVFTSHCCIGTPGQHKTDRTLGKVRIGNGNTFREFSQVHLSLSKRPTVVGNDCYLMKGAHVAHDCYLEDNVTMCNDVALGGHTYIMKGSTLGFFVCVHQKHVIGAYSMLGMGTIVPKGCEIAPGEVYAGNPAKHLKRNTVGLERNNVTEEELEREIDRFHLLLSGW